MGNLSDLAGTLVGFAPFVMVICIVGFAMNAAIQRNRAHKELQKEILAKFTSAQELSDFLKTDAGKKLMQDPVRHSSPRRRAIALATAGLIATGAGVGFHFGGEDKEAVGLFIGVGVALLVASAVSYWLAKRMGMSDTAEDYNAF